MVPIESPQLTDFLPMWPQLVFAGVMAVGIGYTLQLVAQRHTPAAAAAHFVARVSICGDFRLVASWRTIGYSGHHRLFNDFYCGYYCRNPIGRQN